MRYRAYNAFNKDKSLEILFRPNPIRWMDNFVGNDNPIRDVTNWSSEIKYLNDGKISDEIRNMPKDKGGLYMFYLKGPNLPFAEYYILYIGRALYTPSENICKRAMHYLKDERYMIQEMFDNWKNDLYYRYFPDTDNIAIEKNEIALIRSIVPPYNEDIPNKREEQPKVKAF